MDILISISIGLIVITLFVILLVTLSQFISNLISCCNDDPTISFDLFTNLCNLSPKKWALYDSSILYYAKDGRQISLKFSLIDIYRYKHWHKKKIKKDYQEKQAKVLLSLTVEWHSDINSAKEDNIKRMTEAAEKSKFYMERIKEEESKSKELAWKYVIETPDIPDDIVLDFCRTH